MSANKDKTYRIIFSDIDGTLLNSSHEVTEKTENIIRDIVAQGTPFVLVSARMPRGVETIVRKLKIQSPIVCYSGGLILDENRKTISSIGIPRDEAMTIKSYINNAFTSVNCTVYSNDTWIVDDANDPRVVREARIAETPPTEGDVKELLNKDAVVHKILCIGEKEHITQLETALLERFPKYRVYKSQDTYLEIITTETSKGKALEALCRAEKIPVENSMAFGDYFNDIDMLKASGLSVAMANAPEAVKKEAKRITKSNDEDGMYWVLKEYF